MSLLYFETVNGIFKQRRKKLELFLLREKNLFQITCSRKDNSLVSTLETAIIQKATEIRLLRCIILSCPYIHLGEKYFGNRFSEECTIFFG
jgi:hypothetical protein